MTFGRRAWQASALLLMLALIAAGCGQTGAAEADGGQQTDAPVEIEFWHIMPGEMVDKLVDDYNRSQSKVKVKPVFVQNSYEGIVEKIQVQAAAKKMPDVVTNGLLYTRFANETLRAVPLEPFMSRDGFDTDDFFPTMLNLGKSSDGKQIGIPFGISTPVLFYNADHFRAVGLDPDAPPATWEEVRDYAKQLTTGEHAGIHVGIDFGWLYQALMETFGGSMMAADGKSVGLDSAASVEAVQYVSDLVNTDKTMPLLQTVQALDSMGKASVSMLVTSTGGLDIIRSQAKYDLRTAPFPTHRGHRSVPAGGSNMMIFSAEEEKQEAAWDFIKYLSDAKRSIQISKSTGYMVSRKSALNDPEMAEYLQQNPAAQVTYEQIDQMVPWFNFPGAGGTKVQKIISDQVQAALQRQKTAEQAMKDAAEQANALIRE